MARKSQNEKDIEAIKVLSSLLGELSARGVANREDLQTEVANKLTELVGKL